MEKCPFKVGDQVIYKPSARGVTAETMTADHEKLVANSVYTVSKINEGIYFSVEGNNHPGNGLYWTEFELNTKSK